MMKDNILTKDTINAVVGEDISIESKVINSIKNSSNRHLNQFYNTLTLSDYRGLESLLPYSFGFEIARDIGVFSNTGLSLEEFLDGLSDRDREVYDILLDINKALDDVFIQPQGKYRIDDVFRQSQGKHRMFFNRFYTVFFNDVTAHEKTFKSMIATDHMSVDMINDYADIIDKYRYNIITAVAKALGRDDLIPEGPDVMDKPGDYRIGYNDPGAQKQVDKNIKERKKYQNELRKWVDEYTRCQ